MNSKASKVIAICCTVALIFTMAISPTRAAAVNRNPVDLVFVIDSTGSMSEEITNVKVNLENFMEYLEGEGIDIRVGFIEYRDTTYDGEDSTKILHGDGGAFWQSDAKDGVGILGEISVDHGAGGDEPETVLDALGYLAIENTDEGFLEWNERASKFAVLLTDARYKTDNRHALDDLDDAVKELTLHSNQKISTSVVTATDLYDTYRVLTDGTGGILADINDPDFWQSLKALADSIIEMIDTDLDGLPDQWEEEGIDGLDLKAMGADPNVKDLFVEVDYMSYPYLSGLSEEDYFQKADSLPDYLVPRSSGAVSDEGHSLLISLMPSEGQLRAVYEAFKAQGINLHIDAGLDSTDFVTGKTWGELSGSNDVGYFRGIPEDAEWASVVERNFDKSRYRVFRHALMLDNTGGATGSSAGIPGQYFCVSMAEFLLDESLSTDKRDRAVSGTFMHELGHTLGLGHGGRSSSDKVDHTLYKPNYLSVMNYLFQVTELPYISSESGLSRLRHILDYSSYDVPPLDENNLSESEGIDPERVTGDRGFVTWISDGAGYPHVWTGESAAAQHARAVWIAPKGFSSGVDYNNDGDESDTLKMDLGCEYNEADGYVAYGETYSTLQGNNDWNHLVFVGGSVGASGASPSVVIESSGVEEELTYEELKRFIDNEEELIEEAIGDDLVTDDTPATTATTVGTTPSGGSGGGGAQGDGTGILIFFVLAAIVAIGGVYAVTVRNKDSNSDQDSGTLKP